MFIFSPPFPSPYALRASEDRPERMGHPRSPLSITHLAPFVFAMRAVLNFRFAPTARWPVRGYIQPGMNAGKINKIDAVAAPEATKVPTAGQKDFISRSPYR